MQRTRRRPRSGCTPIWAILVVFVALGSVYFFAPLRTNILLLGIDYAPPENAVARSDTIILATVLPLEPYIGMVSIPRDLWVSLPGVGENRINTAHFFGEASQAGGGPAASLEAMRAVFGIQVNYFVRVRFEGFRDVVNAMGGVDIQLASPMAGYPAGHHHLTGNKALAFARSRLGSDDFFRMEQGQILLKAILRQLLQPRYWVRLPGVMAALIRNLDTNLPWWQMPRLGLAVLRAGPDGLDSRKIAREMVTPITTAEGANVLIPDWNQINPMLTDVFGEQ